MQNPNLEKTLAQVLAWGTMLVTVFLLTGFSTDPVNVTKLFALGGVAISAGFLAVNSLVKDFNSGSKITILLSLIFISCLFESAWFSHAPFSQNFYGAFGRNNGILTYLLLAIILISATRIKSQPDFSKMITSLFGAGCINLVYCAWVLLFGDFIGWSNPYGNILGLFGNPDFISAFLGILFTVSFAYAVDSKISSRVRILLLSMMAISFLEIIKSHAIQGVVVSFGGVAIVLFYLIRSKFNKNLAPFAYSAFVILLGFLATFGALQKGPFSFVYKRSVSLRGSYWRAGIEMGKTHPFTGVGLDTYGDWYRSARPQVALIDTPGIKTLSNVSHNVVIDFFASGGWPLLLSYLAILSLGLTSILKISFRTKSYDKVFVSLAAGWLCYQTQSLISINQIGLAIWGWLFTGLLIAYEKTSRSENEVDHKNVKRTKIKNVGKGGSGVVSPQLIAGLGMVLGLFIAAPPLSADSKWFSATRSQNALTVERALIPGYLNPPNSLRYAEAVNLFESSNLPDLSHKYALAAIKFNPDYFDAWKQLFFIKNSSPAEKTQALRNMKRLDPKNPDVTAQ
jgi:O-antigen ligase